MSRGGARKGAGIKKGTVLKKTIEKKIKAEHMRKYFLDRVAEEIGPIVEAQIELAKGVFVLEKITVGRGKNKKTVERVFQKPPDQSMIRYMLDQSLGRATENVNVGGEGGGPIEFVTFQAATKKYQKQKDQTHHEHQAPDTTTGINTK
jgi:hypothetical protein